MNPWDDPNVREALKHRDAADITLLCCPRCAEYSYYNEGSHFTCANEDCGYFCSGQTLDDLIDDGQYIALDDFEDFEQRWEIT